MAEPLNPPPPDNVPEGTPSGVPIKPDLTPPAPPPDEGVHIHAEVDLSDSAPGPENLATSDAPWVTPQYDESGQPIPGSVPDATPGPTPGPTAQPPAPQQPTTMMGHVVNALANPWRTYIRGINAVTNWAQKNPVKALAAGTVLGTALLVGGEAALEFKAPQSTQPTHVDHIPASADGTVSMSASECLDAASAKNQGIHLRDNNHRREEIPKFLLDNIDTIAANNGIIFLERGRNHNEELQKFFQDGKLSHLSNLSWGTPEVTEAYAQLCVKCREKGVKVFCYDVDDAQKMDPKAEEYFASPHYKGAGPRRGSEQIYNQDAVPENLKEGEKLFHEQRIKDNTDMANFVGDTIAAQPDPQKATAYFVCGSYHACNPELPVVRTNRDWLRSKIMVDLPTRVEKDLDELVADRLPEGPRKAVANFDLHPPSIEHVPTVPHPEEPTITKNKRGGAITGLPDLGPDIAEFTVNLPDAVYNRYLASPTIQNLPDEERMAALKGVCDSFVTLANIEKLLDDKFVATEPDLKKRSQEEWTVVGAKNDIMEKVEKARSALAHGDLMDVRGHFQGIKLFSAAYADPALPNGQDFIKAGKQDAAQELVALCNTLEGHCRNFCSKEHATLAALPEQRIVSFNAPADGKVTSLDTLPPEQKKQAEYYLDTRAADSLNRLKMGLMRESENPFAGFAPGEAERVGGLIDKAGAAIKDRRFQDFEVTFREYLNDPASSKLPNDTFNLFAKASQCVSYAGRHIAHGEDIIAAQEAAKQNAPNGNAFNNPTLQNEVAVIRAAMANEGQGLPTDSQEPKPGQGRFTDMIDDRRRPVPRNPEQTNGQTR